MLFLRQYRKALSMERKEREIKMIYAVTNMTVSLADAGQGARAVIVARPAGKGRTPHTFHLLRS
jgi:hypothetical protein